MPTTPIVTSKKSLASYAELRRRVREAIAAGKERAFAAVERESVRTKNINSDRHRRRDRHSFLKSVKSGKILKSG